MGNLGTWARLRLCLSCILQWDFKETVVTPKYYDKYNRTGDGVVSGMCLWYCAQGWLSAGLSASPLKLWKPIRFVVLRGGWVSGSFGLTSAGFKLAC